jgi:hypothetical protein
MPEALSIDSEYGVILIDSFDHVEKDDLSQSLELALQIANDQGLNKIMVDATRQTSLPSIMPLYSFASELSRRACGLKHAIIVAEQSRKDMRFIETVAGNRGAIIQIFSSRDDALSWLQE